MEYRSGAYFIQESRPNRLLIPTRFNNKDGNALALTWPCRGADLAELDLKNRSFIPKGVKFTPVHLSKQSRPTYHGVSFFFPKFNDDKCLCPVETLKVYERKTLSYHNNTISGRNHLFKSFIGKHGPVAPCTIARWLKVMPA